MKDLNLNERVLRVYCEDIEKKEVKSIDETKLVHEFLTFIQLHNEYMKKANAYELASMIRSFETWYINKDKEPNKRHIANYRDVYYVDLGAYNLKYESGFIHPCIVIRKYDGNALVVPCSSKKYGKQDDLIFDIKKGGAFKENTGALLDQVRNVSVTRFKKKMGRVSSEVFEDLLDQLLKKYFCKKYFNFESLENQNKKLKNEVNELQEKLNELQEKSNFKDKQIGELQEKLKEIE